MKKNKLIMANWKMGLSVFDAKRLATELATELAHEQEGKKIAVCPSFLSFSGVSEALKGSAVALGAQNAFWEDSGAYTGEVSPLFLREFGCEFVIVGHSERRKYLMETNEMVHKKTRSVLQNGMTPVVCVGETWEERSEGRRDYILISQTTAAFEGIRIRSGEKAVVAYEPVWAISTGKGISADPEEAEYAIQVIRHVLLDLFDSEIVKSSVQILYGGSVNSENVSDFAKISDGVLVGSASQDKDSFLSLIKSIS